MLRQYEAEDLAPLTEQLRQVNRRANWITLGLIVMLYGPLTFLVITGSKFSPFRYTGPLAGWLGVPLIKRVRGSKRRRQMFTKAQQVLMQAMDRSTLGPLLQIRVECLNSSQLEATRLASTCDTFLLRRLPRATEDELLRLTPEERKILVRLLPHALGSPLTKPAFQPNQEPNLSETEPATAILLALATLKQTGGERTARRILKHFKNESLREAAQEYLNSLRP